jgi:hypothetical protein
MGIIAICLETKRWKLFLGILGANIMLLVFSQYFLVDETVFFNTYSEQLTYDRSMELFTFMRSYSWVSYLVMPLILLIKFSVLSLVIYIGVFFCDLQKDISFGKVFTVVIASEVVFVVATLAKVLWFAFFAGNYTLNDLNFFYPLSLINLFRQSELAPYWIYPMQIVNLFQLLYVFMLAYGLSRISTLGRSKTEKVILLTYVPAIAIWVVFIMFLTIDNQI